MSNKQRDTILRFGIIFFFIVAGFGIVFKQIIHLQYTEKEQWLSIAKTQKRTNVVLSATRGNILDSEGRLLASSLPQYYVYMDCGVSPMHQGGDTLLYNHLSELSNGLSTIIGDKSAEQYRTIILQGHKQQKRHIKLSKRRITYLQKKQIEAIELIKRGPNTSGVTFEEAKRRVHPFGELGIRTLGNVNKENGKGTTGLEARFEKQLRGEDGIGTRQRIGGRWEIVTTQESIDGYDIVTTINADLQDIVESALMARVQEKQADWGCCILMETQTGKIRAIANLDRQSDGSYSEQLNHAVTRVEPGSTFKTIALMAALDDGKWDIDDTVAVTSRPWQYFSVKHSDAHPKDTVYTVRSALAVSSNIALAKIITKGYEGSARKFVRRIKKMGLMDSLYCEIPGAQLVHIPVPNDTVTLSKMAYGYSVLLTPLQIMMFYNAIANHGKMIRPYLVSEIRNDNQVIETFETETVCSSICRKSTLRDIQSALHDVVWDNHLGTASVRQWNGHIFDYKAQSQLVHIAGKTGTAQLLINGHYSGRDHRMTFVGYFPEENPQYTCICMIEHPRPAGTYDAGYDCGGVVRQIAEKTIARTNTYKNGELTPLEY